MPKSIKVKSLLPGDVLLHASKGEVSKLIKWASDSDYSHIAMVFEPGLIAEAVSSGVRFDFPLQSRIEDKEQHFFRIDAWRPSPKGKPIDPDALKALQHSASQMAGRPFALNQWFELGLICAVRNKVPETPWVKWLVALAIDEFVKPDPSRLLCSEFVYLAFHEAQTEPPGLLDPVIARPPRPNRPFPKDLHFLALLKEYLAAKQAGGQKEKVALDDVINAFGNLSTEDVERRWLSAVGDVQAQIAQARAQWIATPLAGTEKAKPHPDLIEPQDFAESPSFKALGTVVV